MTGDKGKQRADAASLHAPQSNSSFDDDASSDSSAPFDYIDPEELGDTEAEALTTDDENISPTTAYEAARSSFDDDDIVKEQRLSSGDMDEVSARSVRQPKTSGFIPTPPVTTDLAEYIPGMYRILDLVSEQGSGGLVDKIIISQESLGRFVNDVCPRAYQSMTHINFGALDKLDISPLGVYGSKSEIVRYLSDKDLVDQDVAQLLLASKDERTHLTQKHLRSGLYLLRDKSSNLVHVLYWPQDATWNDDAISSVARNRETFMRYLTKIADQIVVLISDEHADGIVWDESPVGESQKSNKSGRLFTFQVAKTREQEENVTVHPGFVVQDHTSTPSAPPDDGVVDPQTLTPRLVLGDTNVGVLNPEYEPARELFKNIRETFSEFRLRDFLKNDSFELDDGLSEESLDILLKNGLSSIAEAEVQILQQTRAAEKKRIDSLDQEHLETLQTGIQQQHDLVLCALREELLKTLEDQYGPALIERIRREQGVSAVDTDEALKLLNDLTAIYPRLEKLRRELHADPKLARANNFATRKQVILKAERELSDKPELSSDAQYRLVNELAGHSSDKGESQGWFTAKNWNPRSLFSASDSSSSMPRTDDDGEFLHRLNDIESRFPVLANLAEGAWISAVEYFSAFIVRTTNKLAQQIEDTQVHECNKQLGAQRKAAWRNTLDESKDAFLKAVKGHFIRHSDRSVLVQQVQTTHTQWYTSYHQPSRFLFVGRSTRCTDACLKYRIRTLQLTEGDKHRLQLESTYVPKPKLSTATYTFTLPVEQRVVLCQLLEKEKCLLITSNSQGDMKVFLDRLVNIDQTVTLPNGWKKQLVAEKIGGRSVIAFDESRRMLAICTVERPTLHFFIFDEMFSTLQGYGAPVDLRSWYETKTTIKHVTFRSGTTDELLIVDESLQARIFSLATRLFRPSFVQLCALPLAMVSSPDGSCVFSVERHNGGTILQAYHWGTFGSTHGICLQLPHIPLESWAITSLMKRSTSQCYFVALDSSGPALKSALLSITHKSTEFTFQADHKKKDSTRRPTSSTHMSLLNCHRDVWTRFPVVPAVRRHTFKSSARKPRSLTFVSRLAGDRFRRMFDSMVAKFETSTRKPTSGELGSIEIHAITHCELMASTIENISRFKAGEWLVDILCLIPIHLAVARDNRFIPLKDGVWSVELERSLLGATVEQVIDTLTFGWYESIFQSYMATKPVKVVSSMGEQSVGKSFTMNHLVDTSFAGSAMRTTEGVWMAVTPTDDMLIVALDFEGVHSIERTAQEDSLLVLFNTAISNLVLFRNNFALSRDITGLFQSFQSSSTVLDPSANPSLFQSTLVIIIKDVVESDKDDITTEFSLKFQDIVQTEQEANFISRLHRGSLTIIPWPVIGSQEFYTMFSDVEALLDDQDVSHPQASTFLHKMKTLMAKLKINDWGSIDENLAAHRAQQLLSLLPRALSIGVMELDPVLEPLIDLDTNQPLNNADTDTDAHFFLPPPDGVIHEHARKSHLRSLRASWPGDSTRFADPDASDTSWADDLDQYLGRLAESRIRYVSTWLDINTARFTANSSNFNVLRYEFENLSVALKAHVKLCKMQCANCQLVCVHPRHHEGSHDCQTSHRCPRVCSFMDDHNAEAMSCGMPAGHPGNHICDVSVHLCGQACRLLGKGGCLDRCAKLAGHSDEEHMCQARAHECGKPCSLHGIQLHDRSSYSCPETCCTSSEEEHFEHRCKQRSCPIKCQLCKRFCTNEDHLHGLLDQALHLCGAEHSCRDMCQSDGICKIETTPESISATFTGRHETFEYTKYSQVSKKLQCAILIPPGHTEHSGGHIHEVGGKVFHYCKERCRNCGYFCTLPLGHPQPEHETSHGSMSKTLWTIEGPDGTALEVNGRKFASNDTGAPMLCSMLCKSLGRHAHIDYCLSQDAATCSGADLKHIHERMLPDPNTSKDWISHDLYWRRTGFKDPYPQEDRTEFAKCDAMCTGQEHQADANGRPQPSYCNSPIFHPPHVVHAPPPNSTGYISGDGHHFLCRNPAVLQRAFHVIFVVDRSGSMANTDKRPLDSTPITAILRQRHNNRVGAVYSSLFSFWQARNAALTAGAARRDSYSVILFDHELHKAVSNDFTSTPNALINLLLQYGARGGTNFDMALKAAQQCMEDHWSTERAPVIIFLSDGECNVTDAIVHNLCQRAVSRGMSLSFHSVAFGPSNQNLRRMSQIATDVHNGIRPDPMNPVVPSSYSEAIDSIRLAETFLGIAASLTKPRGALMRTT